MLVSTERRSTNLVARARPSTTSGASISTGQTARASQSMKSGGTTATRRIARRSRNSTFGETEPPATGNPAEIRRANYQDLVYLPSLWREAGNDVVDNLAADVVFS